MRPRLAAGQALILLLYLLIAGTTGAAASSLATIQGRVINKSTNAPLAAANIIVMGTQR